MRRREEQAMEILEGADQSLLDVIDHVLNKGVVVSGEAMLGVAGVDLIYLRLEALLCAADRVQPRARKK
jgi:Gas vesicle protein